jgi:hypothetical protein
MTSSTTINLNPTWREAATIIAAVLESGTAEGRAMARAELFRMASILNELKTSETVLYEVIARGENGPAFGMTFTEQETAESYAEALKAKGFKIDPFPAYNAHKNLAEALAQAAEISGNKGLTQ